MVGSEPTSPPSNTNGIPPRVITSPKVTLEASWSNGTTHHHHYHVGNDIDALSPSKSIPNESKIVIVQQARSQRTPPKQPFRCRLYCDSSGQVQRKVISPNSEQSANEIAVLEALHGVDPNHRAEEISRSLIHNAENLRNKFTEIEAAGQELQNRIACVMSASLSSTPSRTIKSSSPSFTAMAELQYQNTELKKRCQQQEQALQELASKHAIVAKEIQEAALTNHQLIKRMEEECSGFQSLLDQTVKERDQARSLILSMTAAENNKKDLEIINSPVDTKHLNTPGLKGINRELKEENELLIMENKELRNALQMINEERNLTYELVQSKIEDTLPMYSMILQNMPKSTYKELLNPAFSRVDGKANQTQKPEVVGYPNLNFDHMQTSWKLYSTTLEEILQNLSKYLKNIINVSSIKSKSNAERITKLEIELDKISKVKSDHESTIRQLQVRLEQKSTQLQIQEVSAKNAIDELQIFKDKIKVNEVQKPSRIIITPQDAVESLKNENEELRKTIQKLQERLVNADLSKQQLLAVAQHLRSETQAAMDRENKVWEELERLNIADPKTFKSVSNGQNFDMAPTVDLKHKNIIVSSPVINPSMYQPIAWNPNHFIPSNTIQSPPRTLKGSRSVPTLLSP